MIELFEFTSFSNLRIEHSNHSNCKITLIIASLQYATPSNDVKMTQLSYGAFGITKEECEKCI